jgi:hypothetical protein
MTTATDTFQDARELQWLHKPAAMSAMAAAVCRLAVEKAGAEFSANDLTLDEHGGRGVCGSIFKRLAKDDVIEPACVLADGQPMQKTILNAGGNRIGLWRLKSYARALRLIEAHSARGDARPTEENLTQAELITV